VIDFKTGNGRTKIVGSRFYERKQHNLYESIKFFDEGVKMCILQGKKMETKTPFIRIVVFSFVLLSIAPVFGQAFDGEFDRRLIITQSFHPNGALGLEMGYEKGVSEYVSWRFMLGYAYKHGPVHLPPEDTEEENLSYDLADFYTEEELAAREGFFIEFLINFHYGELIGLNDNVDLYSGVNVLKNIGVQTGVRFQILEYVALLGEINVPLKKRLFSTSSAWNYVEDYELPFLQIGFALGF